MQAGPRHPIVTGCITISTSATTNIIIFFIVIIIIFFVVVLIIIRIVVAFTIIIVYVCLRTITGHFCPGATRPRFIAGPGAAAGPSPAVRGT